MDFDAANDFPHAALQALGTQLHQAGYRFVTVTPETHRRVLSRHAGRTAQSLRDVFGWNLPFDPDLLPDGMHARLEAAGLLSREGAQWRSRFRFATLGDAVYLHSAYPTSEANAVFFGPDTYRFVALIERVLPAASMPLRRIVDVGCGGGAGGLAAVRALRGGGHPPPSLELVDINPSALAVAALNASFAGVVPEAIRQADLYAGTAPEVDAIVANPPYLLDPDQRLYRHGGGRYGFALALRIVAEGLPLLAPGGVLVLYTGVPIVAGRDLFFEAVDPLIDAATFSADYTELDPDVFGEELDNPGYAEVERIAVVALVVRRAVGASASRSRRAA